jgi:hypothetical protein
MAQQEPEMVDLSQFESLDDAMHKVEPGDRYVEVGKLAIPLPEGGMPLTLAFYFWFSMIARCEGLHRATASEIRSGNPHAVFPLIRGLAEAVVLVIYVLDHPEYVQTLTTPARDLPRDGPKRKSIQALINYASEHAPGMKLLYAELSEATHFGSTAMWASTVIEGESEKALETSWASYPRWRDKKQALIACAQTLELSDALVYYLTAFFARHVLPLKDI